MRITFASVLLAAAAAAQSPCPPRGLSLESQGGRLGDAWAMRLSGSPNVPGVLAFDVTPGPIPLPFGSLCLGGSTLMQVFPFLLDGAGRAAPGGILPPDRALSGITLFWSALTLDAAQPSGVGLSNGAELTMREPRLYFIDPGVRTPFGTTPGSVADWRVLTESSSFSQPLASSVLDAAFVRERNWLAILLGNSTVVALDGTTGGSTLTAPLTGAAATSGRLLALPGGASLALMATGTPPSPFSPGTPGSVHFLSLPSGAVSSSVTLPTGTNPDAILLAPGTNTCFLRVATGVQPIDIISGFVHPAIPLPTAYGGLVDWQVAGNILYCLHGGRAPTPFGGGLPAALSAVDVATQGVLFTTQLVQAAPVSMLRAGPGTTGPSLYVYGATSATLAEFAQVSGAATGSLVIGNGIGAMELSALRTEWLLLRDGSAGTPTLFSMAAGTMSLVTQQTLAANAQPLLAVSPSAGLGRACLVQGTNTVVPFWTDPVVPPFTSGTLPISSGLFKVVSD